MSYVLLLLAAVAVLVPLPGWGERGWEIDEHPVAQAECTQARVGADRRAETARIHACLAAVARPPRNEERFLYTYGHRAKMEEIRRSSKRDFCIFEYTRQNTVEGAKHELALRRANAIDAAKIAEARQVAPQLDDLMDVEERARQQGVAYSQAAALNLVALDKIYPGFLDGIDTDAQQELAVLSTIPGPASRGAATGLRIALASDDPYEKASATTGGKGVYFARDAASKFAHFEGGALACAVTDRVRIVDIYDAQTRRFLIDAQIILPDGTPGRSFLKPNTAHNLLVAPMEFEAAAVGFVFLFSSRGEAVYVDKCALDLNQACRNVSLDDFRDCANFEEFGRNAGTAVFQFVEAQGDFSRKFFDIWNQCAADDFEDEHVCRRLAPNLHPSIRAYLQKNAKKEYQRAMKDCGLKS